MAVINLHAYVPRAITAYTCIDDVEWEADDEDDDFDAEAYAEYCDALEYEERLNETD